MFARPHLLLLALAAALLSLTMVCRAELDPKSPISRYIHQVWQDEQGLPQSNIIALTQTHDGFLWFGTEAGLVRFDGVHFTVYDKRNTPALKSNSVTAVLEDRRQNLWVGTASGLVRLRNQVFEVFPLPAGAGGNISTLYEDQQGRVWVGLDGKGIAVLKDDTFSVYTRKDGIAGDEVFSINGAADGSVWIGARTGLTRWQDGRFTTYTIKNGLPSDFIRAIYPDSRGDIWIGTHAGLSRFSNGKFRNYTTKDGLSSDLIQCLYEDPEHSLWIGTLDGGLNRLHDGQFSNYRVKDGFSSDEVTSLYGDRDGNLWAGTPMGLNWFGQGTVTTLTTADGLPSNIILATYQDHEGDLWIGTLDRGVVRFHDGKAETYSVKQGLSSNAVFTVAEDSDHAYWLGTRNGLNRLKNGRIVTFTSKDGLAGDAIRASLIDRQGTLWFGGQGGLTRVQNGKFTAFTKGISELRIHAIAEDREGVLWLGSDGGLIRFQNGVFSAFTTKNSSLSDDLVLTLYQDPQGPLWIGTQGGGLNRLQHGRFTSFNTKDGLLDDEINSIISVNAGSLWLSANHGIFRVQTRQLEDFAQGKARSIESLVVGPHDGMLSKECNGGFQPSSWRTSEGTLVFPTMRGVVQLDPSHAKTRSLTFPVSIERVEIDRKNYIPGSEIVSPPGRGELEFAYTASNFSDPQHIEFQYQLEGYDREWVYAGASREAHYTNIPPGKYQFRVRERQGNDPWTGLSAVVNITLHTPFYKTLWFYSCCGLAGIALAFGLFQLRVMQLKTHEHDLKILVNQRTAELQEEIMVRKQAELEAIQARDQLRFQATHDVLTGIWNRGAILDFLAREIERGNRADSPTGLLMLDVDHFKRVNDTYGHLSGDSVLREVVHRISLAIRTYDSVGRYGGEEFLIVLPGCDRSQALQSAERVRWAIAADPISLDSMQIAVTVSVGVASTERVDDERPLIDNAPNRPRCGEVSMTELLIRADAALYEAKARGRNRSQLSENALYATRM